MYQAAIESINICNIVTTHYMCKLKLPDLLSYTLFFSTEWRYKFGALNLMANSVANLSVFGGLILIGLSMALCFDLWLMLSRPFLMKDKLVPIYTGISILFSLTFTVMLLP